jgi:hypothetical protein
MVALNVEHNNKVDVRTFLQVLLKKTYISDAPAPNDILDRCLKAVLPICEEHDTRELLIE